jgi:hypothetical protein
VTRVTPRAAGAGLRGSHSSTSRRKWPRSNIEGNGVTSAIFSRNWIKIDLIEEWQTLRRSPVDFPRKLDQNMRGGRSPLT